MLKLNGRGQIDKDEMDKFCTSVCKPLLWILSVYVVFKKAMNFGNRFFLYFEKWLFQGCFHGQFDKKKKFAQWRTALGSLFVRPTANTLGQFVFHLKKARVNEFCAKWVGGAVGELFKLATENQIAPVLDSVPATWSHCTFYTPNYHPDQYNWHSNHMQRSD